MARGSRRCVFCLLLLLMPLLLGGCSGGLLVGDILRGLATDVSVVIQNAGESGEAVTVSAAGAVQDAINNAESAFAEDLGKRIKDVDDAVRSNIQQLQLLVNDLQKGTTQLLFIALAGAQQLINTLPFTNKNPQVTSYTPRFTAPGRKSIDLSVRGNFWYALEKKKTPTLTAAGRTYEPALNTTQELGFTIPADIVATSADLNPVTLKLDIPYEKGKVFKSVHPGVFRLLVTGLPASPIKKLTLTNSRIETGTSTREVRWPPSGILYLNSFDCLPHVATTPVPADPGWTVDRDSVSVQVPYNKNPVNANVGAEVNQNQVVINAETRPACLPFNICNGCGAINYYVTFTETQPVTTKKNEVVDVPIGWGDSLALPVTPHQWRVDSVLFNGRTAQFTGSDNSNPYLRVTDDGESIVIATPAPETLSTPP